MDSLAGIILLKHCYSFLYAMSHFCEYDKQPFGNIILNKMGGSIDLPPILEPSMDAISIDM